MKKQVQAWLKLAAEDLASTRVLLRENIYNQVCFHAQQTAEKSLKALIELKTKVPKEHSLSKLFEICRELGYELSQFRDGVEYLDMFYTSTRYPFVVGILPTGVPSKQDAEKSLSIANDIYRFCEDLLKQE